VRGTVKSEAALLERLEKKMVLRRKCPILPKAPHWHAVDNPFHAPRHIELTCSTSGSLKYFAVFAAVKIVYRAEPMNFCKYRYGLGQPLERFLAFCPHDLPRLRPYRKLVL
jgi:hypothetical protein